MLHLNKENLYSNKENHHFYKKQIYLNKANCMENVTHVSSLKVLLRWIPCDLDLALSARSPTPPLPANGKVSTIFPFSGTDPPPKRTYEMMCPMALCPPPPSKVRNLTEIRKKTATYPRYIQDSKINTKYQAAAGPARPKPGPSPGPRTGRPGTRGGAALGLARAGPVRAGPFFLGGIYFIFADFILSGGWFPFFLHI